MVQPGTKGLKSVCDAFGYAVLNDDGTLNRPAGLIVFADEEADAERLPHHSSLLLRTIEFAVQRHDPGGIVIIDAALMIESGSFRRLDKLIVVLSSGASVATADVADGLSRGGGQH